MRTVPTRGCFVLTLLLSPHALRHSGNVPAAGQLLGVTQPTMSGDLRRRAKCWVTNYWCWFRVSTTSLPLPGASSAIDPGARGYRPGAEVAADLRAALRDT